MIMSAKYYEEPPQDVIHLYDEVDGVWSLIDEVPMLDLSDAEHTGIITHHNNTKMPVGDVNSDEKGTGARALGAEKKPLQWIPVRFWLDYFQSIAYSAQRDTGMESWEVGHLLGCVLALSEFQEGKGTGRELQRQLGPVLMEHAAEVFEYGANKYAAWNWMKGMSWSVVTGCALRHIKAVFEGELLDDESGLTHVGHFACNIVMLAMYDTTYQEGNDFPKEEYFK